MKAMVLTQYGSPEVLQLREIDKPTPKANEVLIRIEATTVTMADCEIRTLRFPLWLQVPIRLLFGITRPRKNKVLGTELAGEVEAVGAAVQNFKPGDKVFGSAGMGFGTNAEYRCLNEKSYVALKPTTMSYQEAAAVPFGGRDALHFLRKGNLQRGEKILIVGAGGSIGSYAVQLARYFGATVTAVDSSGKLEMLRALGAEQLIDYTREDFTQRGETYDVIFDAVGKSPYAESLRCLTPNGRYILANPAFSQLFRAPWTSMRGSRKVIVTAANPTTDDLLFLKGLIEAGTIHSVIDRVYPLEQLADAHRYVDTGQKKGNVVITVEHTDKS